MKTIKTLNKNIDDFLYAHLEGACIASFITGMLVAAAQSVIKHIKKNKIINRINYIVYTGGET